MTSEMISLNGWMQLIVYFAVLFACVKPLGSYMAEVYMGERTLLSPLLSGLERLIYRVCGVTAEQEMTWREYAAAMLTFSVIGFAGLYAILRLQGLPWLNPAQMGGVSP